MCRCALHAIHRSIRKQAGRCSAHSREHLTSGTGQPHCNEEQFAAGLDTLFKARAGTSRTCCDALHATALDAGRFTLKRSSTVQLSHASLTCGSARPAARVVDGRCARSTPWIEPAAIQIRVYARSCAIAIECSVQWIIVGGLHAEWQCYEYSGKGGGGEGMSVLII